MPEFRVKLDVPYLFATEPGYTRAVHCIDFRPEKDSFVNTFRDPVTGLVFLRPKSLEREWHTDLQPLGNFTVGNAAFWKAVKRSVDAADLFTNVLPTGLPETLIELLLDIAIIALNADTLKKDDMKWVLQSLFRLEVDESFALYYYSLTDETTRKNNWFYLQWDDIGLHFSQHGTVQVYRYNRANLNQAPALVESFTIAEPQELLQRPGYFIFIPVPLWGLLIYHSLVPPKMSEVPSDVLAGVKRGHLVVWPSRRDTNGNYRVFEASPLRIGLNPYQRNLLGIQLLRFAPSGSYTDSVFDPGYKPSTAPIDLSPILIPNGRGSVTITARNKDNTADYVAGTDRQGRIRATLTTNDQRYTPFLAGYYFRYAPQFTQRNTNAFEPTTVLRLEYTQDEWGRFEGSLDCEMAGSQMVVAERGDTTFQIERRANSQESWQVVDGGFAKVEEMEFIKAPSSRYRVRWSLHGLFERFKEIHQYLDTAFDGVKVGDAINVVLQAAGFSPIPPNEMPPQAQRVTLPVSEGNWKFAPRAGDSGDEILRSLLMFLKREKEEWRLRYDWQNQKWVLERKPRDTMVWTLSPFSTDAKANESKWYYSELHIQPDSPEANYILLEGNTKPDSSGKRLIASAVNRPSLTDPNSVDYLGRLVSLKVEAPSLTTQEDVNLWLRRVYDAVAHRRVKATIVTPKVQPAIVPLQQVRIWDSSRVVRFTGWVKQISVVWEQDYPQARGERMVLHVDSIWDGELD